MTLALTYFGYSDPLRWLSVVILLWGTVLLAGCQSAPVAPPPPPLPKLLAAVQAGDVAQVKQLVAAGEKVDQYAQGKSSLSIAAERCDQAMTETLVALGATINPNMDYDVAIKAMKCNNLSLLDTLASMKGARLEGRLNWKGEDVSPLAFAAANGHFDMVKLLLAKGVDVNKVCQYDFCQGDHHTPLHLAALTANADMAKLLINHGARLHAVNKQDATPLTTLAVGKPGIGAPGPDTDRAKANMLATVKSLIEGGANPNLATLNRGPALSYLMQGDKVRPDCREVADYMISKGASLTAALAYNQQRQKDMTAQHERITKEEQLKKEQAAKAAAEAEAEVPSISSDSKGGCMCTRRAQRWVSGSSGSGAVRGSKGHYEFYDEQVPCACPR
jgi:ankyrin repeat protein